MILDATNQAESKGTIKSYAAEQYKRYSSAAYDLILPCYCRTTHRNFDEKKLRLNLHCLPLEKIIKNSKHYVLLQMNKLYFSCSELSNEKAAILASCLFNVDELYLTDVDASKPTFRGLEMILKAIKNKPCLVNVFMSLFSALQNAKVRENRNTFLWKNWFWREWSYFYQI